MNPASLPPIGSVVRVRMEMLEVDCRVLETGASYGRTRIVVTPMSGAGEQRIELGRLVPIKQPLVGYVVVNGLGEEIAPSDSLPYGYPKREQAEHYIEHDCYGAPGLSIIEREYQL